MLEDTIIIQGKLFGQLACIYNHGLHHVLIHTLYPDEIKVWHMSLTVSDTYWRLRTRKRAHQGCSLGFKSLGAMAMDVLILIRKL